MKRPAEIDRHIAESAIIEMREKRWQVFLPLWIGISGLTIIVFGIAAAVWTRHLWR